LDSIFAQSLPLHEVVVTDDRSTDATPEILADYARRHPLRFSINPERLGFVQNFAKALGQCEGDLVAPCDQDDLWLPERLEKLVADLGDASLVYAPALRQIDPHGDERSIEVGEVFGHFLREKGTGRRVVELAAENWIPCHTMLLRRDVLNDALPIPSGQPYHDAWIAVAAAARNGICWSDEDLMVYRKHAASVTFEGDTPPPRALFEILFPNPQQKARRQEFCLKEQRRLDDFEQLCQLTAPERRMIEALHALYAEYPRWLRWYPAWLAWKMAPYFHSVPLIFSARCRFALKAALGSW
jgi:glycosyltransferase involved in cell wall biosynthesis